MSLQQRVTFLRTGLKAFDEQLKAVQAIIDEFGDEPADIIIANGSGNDDAAKYDEGKKDNLSEAPPKKPRFELFKEPDSNKTLDGSLLMDVIGASGICESAAFMERRFKLIALKLLGQYPPIDDDLLMEITGGGAECNGRDVTNDKPAKPASKLISNDSAQIWEEILKVD